MQSHPTPSPYEQLLLSENLTYAWRKAKRLYSAADGYTDLGEIAEFEVDLENRLCSIRDRFIGGRYDPIVLRICPLPKKLASDKTVDRQYFHVNIDDQVAWIALVNVIGPSFDRIMPPWSYGNRLYRAAWYETDDPNYPHHPRLELGPYRHQPGHLYRRFQHSWPLFRRHIALTAKVMARPSPLDSNTLEPADSFALASAQSDKLTYLRTDFWSAASSRSKARHLHYAAFDLENFYPGIQVGSVLKAIEARMADSAIDERILLLAEDMLRFCIDPSGIPEGTLDDVHPPIDKARFQGIPTGLFVAGFLANLAMLPVDRVVDQLLSDSRHLAHFRFVDDHCVISYDFDELCRWIVDYQSLLQKHGIEPRMNPAKYSPASLGLYIGSMAKSTPKNFDDLRRNAQSDTRVDGTNLTPLMTQTLAQVSAIAATDPNTLDDNDLMELLRRLEWLLLADIPEHELRPSTRMAFAAGRIATFAPQAVPEIPGIVEAQRSHARLGNTDSHVRLQMLESRQAGEEQRHLRYYFELLLQAFRACPENARLFSRVHQYCRATGYKGIPSIAQWIAETREGGFNVWADYYSGLSLLILARGACLCARALVDDNALRLTKRAALEHLRDIVSIDTAEAYFLVPRSRETWYQSVARRTAGIFFLTVSTAPLPQNPSGSSLCDSFARLSERCIGADFASGSPDWETYTGRHAGVWAHAVEGILSPSSTTPSFAWNWFQKHLRPDKPHDRNALRRYPEHLSDSTWKRFVVSGIRYSKDDTGWLRDSIGGVQHRISDAIKSSSVALRRAGRSYASPGTRSITLTEWTRFLSQCSAFDPRRSEWTALAIVRRLAASYLAERAADLHPSNVVVPRTWQTAAASGENRSVLPWEAWRAYITSRHQGQDVHVRSRKTCIVDYRYYCADMSDIHSFDRRLVSVGRLLLGLLLLDFRSPAMWNIRGNETTIPFFSSVLRRSLSISTPTMLLIDSCLSPRLAETRTIAMIPVLFGWKQQAEANDVSFDPPLVRDHDDLVRRIDEAQCVLERHQISVAGSQPRQLIPFRLSDFGAKAEAYSDTEDADPDTDDD